MVGPAPAGHWRKSLSAVQQIATRRIPGRVYYTSFGGRFSDNPRAIYEALVERQGLSHVWQADDVTTFPPAVGLARLGRPDYARQLGQASHVVANFSVPQYVKRPGRTYLQTWHGTPVKTIGLDNPQRRTGTAGHRRAIRDYAQWDFLVSQNPHSSSVFRRAFAYDGEILETGYPRNDVLRSPRATEIGREVRARFGVPDGVTAVLYAPTYRDDVVDASEAELSVDLARLRAALGPEVVVLLRLHHWVTGRPPRTAGWIDVSDHGDIRDLYLAADVLVTDYSSSMFDFAVTGKPIVLHVPDLDHYSRALRGLYFDVVEQAPGPVTRTTDELICALSDAVTAPTSASYADFVARYCPWDDGSASQRVIDRAFRELC